MQPVGGKHLGVAGQRGLELQVALAQHLAQHAEGRALEGGEGRTKEGVFSGREEEAGGGKQTETAA